MILELNKIKYNCKAFWLSSSSGNVLKERCKMKNVKFGTFSYTFPSVKVQVHVRVSLLVQNMQRGICNIRTKKTDHTKLFEILPQFFHCIVDLFKRLVLDPLVVTDLYSLLINIIFYFIDDLFKLLFDCYKLIFN